MENMFSYIETLNNLQRVMDLPAARIYQQHASMFSHASDIFTKTPVFNEYNEMYERINTLAPLMSLKKEWEEITTAFSTMTSFTDSFYEQTQFISDISQTLQPILNGYTVLDLHPKSRDKEQQEEADQITEKVVSEIYLPDEKKVITDDSPIITIKPANDKVFSYLAEHPNELYNLTSREFEEFMAQLYNKLGYNTELTKATRDGGKDIILRKPDILGDMVFYVECKQYKIQNKVGIDIIQRFAGIIEMDKVNGGIIATTSFFSPDAEKWILEKDLNCRILMHNFDVIQNMLKMAVA